MKWPRGRFNGQRIIGVDLHFKLDVTEWRWLPLVLPTFGGFHWLCFLTWWNWNYE